MERRLEGGSGPARPCLPAQGPALPSSGPRRGALTPLGQGPISLWELPKLQLELQPEKRACPGASLTGAILEIS